MLNIIIGTGGFAGGGATAVGFADDADSVVGGGLIIVYFRVAGADGDTALSSSGTLCLGATRGALVAY